MNNIDPTRFLRMLRELAAIGSHPDGGVRRLAFTDQDLQGRTYVADRLSGAGLDVRVDAIGNLFGVLAGTSNEPAVMIGSHTDTVATGGRFDGALGVIAAVETATVIAAGPARARRSLVVASFVNEEGVRFMPDMMGSLYMRGDLTTKQIRSICDAEGTTIGTEIDRLGFNGTGSLDDVRPDRFLELHIEQGPVLEEENLEIGVVTGVQGLSWTEVTVVGSGNHAGTTPMDRRRDAGAAAGALMERVRTLPDVFPGLRVTIGTIRCFPNLVNVIPSRIEFTVDLRHRETAVLSGALAQLVDMLINLRSPCDVTWHVLADAPPVLFADPVVTAIQAATDELDLNSRRMISGAGHDAQILAGMMEAGMIFVPSRKGISHDPAEYTSDADCVAGANVLLCATRRLLDD